jgi:hypothetical protein
MHYHHHGEDVGSPFLRQLREETRPGGGGGGKVNPGKTSSGHRGTSYSTLATSSSENLMKRDIDTRLSKSDFICQLHPTPQGSWFKAQTIFELRFGFAETF